MPSKLGTFKKMDVRTQWPKEDKDFTPWLAQDDNLAALGEALGGLDLELDTTEASVGPYSADILAKTIDGYVVIENQLGKTDHDHLGKALTYASFLDAKTIVWIATQFTEEHHKAIEWLNEKTDDISLYAVVLELWKIDDSRPAVRFNVISKPADVRTSDVKEQVNLSPTKEIQLAFWQMLRDKLIGDNILSSARPARPRYWYNVSIGNSKIYISNTLHAGQGVVSARLCIKKSVAAQALPQLMKQKENIEKELGVELQWDSNPDAQAKFISISRNMNISDRASWDNDIDWLANKIKDFKKAFTQRIKALNLKTANDDNDDENDV